MSQSWPPPEIIASLCRLNSYMPTPICFLLWYLQRLTVSWSSWQWVAGGCTGLKMEQHRSHLISPPSLRRALRAVCRGFPEVGRKFLATIVLTFGLRG